MALRLQKAVLASAAWAFLNAAPARAEITIELQNADANGGALTQVGSGATSASFSGAYGDYNVQNITGSDIFPINFGTNSFDVTIPMTRATTNTLTIIVTETGVTSLPTDFLSTLTENNLTTGWTVQETTWVNITQLFSHTFAGVGHEQQLDGAGVADPFSLSEEFVLTPNGIAGQDQSTININSTVIPEPSTWVLLALGFGGLGYAASRRSAKPRLGSQAGWGTSAI